MRFDLILKWFMILFRAFKTDKKNFISINYLFLSLIIAFPFTLQFSQISQVNYVPITTGSGLSQNTIHDILQDEQGFLWIATEDGLNKYDGYKFTVYKNNPQDSTSISDNFIWTIYKDSKGALWIGTNNGGLCRYESKTDRFFTYRNNPSDNSSLSLNNVRAIIEDRKGNLWIGTEGGLNKFNRKNGKFVRYIHNSELPYSISNNVILSLFVDRSGTLWVGSDGGLDKYDEKKDGFINYSYKAGDQNSLRNNVVLSICQDNAGYLWLGTLNGITRFDLKENKFTHFLTNSSESKITNINRINKIIEDKTGTIWVGTGDGFLYLDNARLNGSKSDPTFIKSNILNHNNILSLYESNSGIVWIGTAEDGIMKFYWGRVKFQTYKHDPFDPKSLSHNTVRAIYQEKNGTLWIGTLGGGLNRFDSEYDRFIHYKNDPENKFSLNDNSISAICKDRYGYLWIGTWNGGLNRSLKPLHFYGTKDIKFIHYNYSASDKQSLSSNIIQAIFEDSGGNLWIGTGIGLDVYNRRDKKFIRISYDQNNPNGLCSNLVQSCIIEDRAGNMWFGTWDGLSKLPASEKGLLFSNPASIKFINFKHLPWKQGSLSDDRVISAYEDNSGNLWFGTYGGGINEMTNLQQSSADPKFINYSVKNGLPSNIIYSIKGDGDGNLWMSTDNGLSMYEKKTKSFRNYDVTDGLQGNQFYWGAGFKGNNGELFFGGTNGFNSFFPKEIKKNTHVPPVVITDFQIFNKPVLINTVDSPLKKAINYTNKIILSYNQNVFSFDFAALDYAAPNKNQYAYMMEGFDKDWIYSDKRRFVTYTNLDPGEYIFRVKGSNNDGVWNEKGASLQIEILPPFWRTWWFILITSTFLGGIILLMIYVRVKHLLDIERFRTKLAADLHDNIGSGLTEISILSEVISHKLDSIDDNIKKSLYKISENSRNLIDSMSDIVWLVNPNRDSLYDLILRLRDTYTELSSYASISFRSENLKSLEKISLSMEHRQHLYLIFKEGINNCITHSGCTEISLDAFIKGKKLEMILKDNGKGFETGTESGGNGLINIKRRAEAIGGRIDIFSKKGEGTTLHFIGNIL